MILNKPSLDFCIKNITLGWEDVIWAVEHEIFTWKDVHDFAMYRLNDINSISFNIDNSISMLTKNEASEIMDLARDAVILTQIKDDIEIKRRWLYLLLLWIYRNRATIEQPLDMVEYLYAEFDYPESIEEFVNFLPPKDNWDPSKHSIEENQNRLLNKWNSFLEYEKFILNT